MAARCEGQELAAASTCEAARALSGPSSITAAQATAAGSMRIISRFFTHSALAAVKDQLVLGLLARGDGPPQSPDSQTRAL
jgi:hypothetical protein